MLEIHFLSESNYTRTLGGYVEDKTNNYYSLRDGTVHRMFRR